jgi:hypothetical protein
MLKRILFDHPRSVGESYFEHLAAASSFGIAMMLGGCACLLHAIVPCLFVRTGSGVVGRLHETMTARRPVGK